MRHSCVCVCVSTCVPVHMIDPVFETKQDPTKYKFPNVFIFFFPQTLSSFHQRALIKDTFIVYCWLTPQISRPYSRVSAFLLCTARNLKDCYCLRYNAEPPSPWGSLREGPHPSPHVAPLY